MWIIDMEGSLCQNSRGKEGIEKGHEKPQAGIAHLLCFCSEQNVDGEAGGQPSHTQVHMNLPKGAVQGFSKRCWLEGKQRRLGEKQRENE